MPGTGFGSGPFGAHPFGEWAWSKNVLYEFLPGIYRDQDLVHGKLLEKYTDSQRPLFDNLRRKIRAFGDLRNPDLARTAYAETLTYRLGPVVRPMGTIRQRGIDGSVNSLREFTARTARFGEKDRGRVLELTGSTVSTNNKSVTIARVVNPTTVTTTPLLDVDTSAAIRWTLRDEPVLPTDCTEVEVWGGEALDVSPGWMLNDGFSTFEVIGRTQFRTAEDNKYLTDREGLDGVFVSVGGNVAFLSNTAKFTQFDAGKVLSVPTAANTANAGQFVIDIVLDPASIGGPYSGYTGVLLQGGPNVVEEIALYWALLPRATFKLRGTATPKGVVEQSGHDLTVVSFPAPGTTKVESLSARFKSTDLNKIVLTRGFAGSLSVPIGNITVINSETQVTINVTLPAGTGIYWELRSASDIGDNTEVEANPPSLLSLLAEDFGVELDRQESENRQRGWVHHVTDWIGKKGADKVYRILGDLSGYSVVPKKLWRVDLSWALFLPPGDIIEVDDTGAGKFGGDAALSLVGGRLRLATVGGVFDAGDLGKQLRITNALLDNDNEKLYTITGIVNSSTLEFAVEDYDSTNQTVPDEVKGWKIVKLYTTYRPTIPLFDEINIEALQEIVGTTAFHVDKFCQEVDFEAEFKTLVNSNTQLTVSRWEVSTSNITKLAVGVVSTPFVVGETVTGLVSGATGVYQGTDPGFFYLSGVVGTFTNAEDITGNIAGVSKAGPTQVLCDVGIVLQPGRWVLIDKDNVEFFLDTAPVGGKFEVSTAIAPATGLATLKYDCDEVLIGCGYCPASTMQVVSTALVGPNAPQISHTEFKRRLRQVTPIHVNLIYTVA